MFRLLMTALFGGVLATAAIAQTPTPMPLPAPKPMPANPAPMNAATAPTTPAVSPTVTGMPLTTSPTISPQMVAEACHNDACCDTRLTLRERLSVLWTGRHGREDIGCPTCFPGYTSDGYKPIYASPVMTDGPCCAAGRCPRFGVGHFAGHDCNCPVCQDAWRPLRMHLQGCFDRPKECREKQCRTRAHCRIPTPYATPVRYYIDDCEELNWQRLQTGCGANGRWADLGIGSGVTPHRNLGAGRATADCGGPSRLARLGLGLGCGRPWFSRGDRHDWANGCRLIGTPFNECLRFAHDEKMQPPAIVASEFDSSYGLHPFHYYAKKNGEMQAVPAAVPTANPIQQAGYKTPLQR